MIDKDDNNNNSSSNGDVLPADSNVIMLDAAAGESSSRAGTGKKAKGKDKETASTGTHVTITGVFGLYFYLSSLFTRVQMT